MSQRGPLPRPAVPIAFAHQGGLSEHPRNSLPAFLLALEAQCTGFESDVWLTADGVPVLDHDGIAGGVPIRTLQRSELPDQVATLGDLYAICGPSAPLSLDVRDPEGVPRIIATARAAGGAAVSNLWLCTELVAEARTWRLEDDDVRIVHSTELAEMTDGFGAHLLLLRAEGVDVLNLHETDWDEGLVAHAHDAGLLAFGWDTHTRDGIERLLGYGCDGIYSDNVAVLVDVLGCRTTAGPAT